MNCPSKDLLRCHADGELSAPEAERIDEHLRSCERCGKQFSALRDRADRIQRTLGMLAPGEGESGTDPAVAYARFVAAEPAPPPRPSLSWRAPVWGSAAACVLVLLFTFAPARSWGQKFLSMLRVQKIAVVPVDLEAATAQLRGSGNEKLIAQLISDNVVVTMKPGDPTQAASAQNATEMAGFPVIALDVLGTPQRISVTGEGAFQMTLDHDRIQAVLDAAGRSDIQVPQSIDGSIVAVHIPKAVHMAYGSCSQAQGGANCINFVQIPSPAVSVPPDLNLAALAQAGLQIAGMDAAEAQAFSQTVDWSSTLVIPIPLNASSYQTIAVDGVNGTLVETPARANFAARYALIWVKNGIIYSLAGSGTSDTALTVAESLH
jgi:anti-sigma factor RsiW